jgi:hypothetical protein
VVMTPRGIVLLLGLVLVQTGAVRADETLTEAARRENARRVAQKPQKVKKFTDDDLKKLPGKGAPADPAAAGTPAPDPGVDMSGDEESKPESWRPAVDAARAEVRSREAAVKELEGRIQELRNEFSQRTRLNEPNRERRIADDIAAVATQLENARQGVEDAKQALDDLLEEARRAGVSASQLE